MTTTDGPLRTIVLEPARHPGPTAPIAADPEFMLFLHDRLVEEVIAATRRRETAAGDQLEVAERGLRLLDELVADLRDGRPLDTTSLRLLRVAYGRHPEFRSEWAADA